MSELIGNWGKVSDILNSARLKVNLLKANAKVGNYGASEIKKGIVSGKNFAPNHPYTVAKKGSSKPLIDKGDLVGSITHVMPDESSVFIGVKRTTQNGKDVANIAAVHEFGCTIKVTPKMRAYLHYNGLHLKQTTEYIHIPARPFLSNVFKNPEFMQKVADIYKLAVKEAFSI